MSSDYLNYVMRNLKVVAERQWEKMTGNCVIIEDEWDAVF